MIIHLLTYHHNFLTANEILEKMIKLTEIVILFLPVHGELSEV